MSNLTKPNDDPDPDPDDPKSLLFHLAAPIIFIGLCANCLVLLTWSMITGPRWRGVTPTVYVMQALAVSDILYLTFYIPARLYRFPNFYADIFVRNVCYGNRNSGIYLTLMLAAVRFIMVVYPLSAPRLLSAFRVKFTLTALVAFSVVLQALQTMGPVILPKEQRRYYSPVVNGGLGRILPGLLQLVLMTVVVVKVWNFKAASVESSVLMVRQINKAAPVGEAKADRPGIRGAEQGEGSRSLHDTFSVNDPKAEPKPRKGSQGQRNQSDPSLGLPPKRFSETYSVFAPVSRTVSKQQQQQQREGSGQRTVISDHSSQSRSSGSVHNRDMEWRVVLTIFAICLLTFLAYPVCSALNIVRYQTNLFDKSTKKVQLMVCTCLKLINSSFNVVFYLFIFSFRDTFLKRIVYLASAAPTRVHHHPPDRR